MGNWGAVQMLLISGEAVVAHYSPLGRNEYIMKKEKVNKAIEFAKGLLREVAAKSAVELCDGSTIDNPLERNAATAELLDKYVARQEANQRQLKRAKEAVASAPVSLKNVTLNGFHALTQAFSPEMSALRDAERKVATTLWWNTTVANYIADRLNADAERQDEDVANFNKVCSTSASFTK